MGMGWLGRLFDQRDTVVRLLLLDLSGLGYLLFRPPDGGPATATQWVLGLVAFTSIVALHRWPFVNLLVQAALLATSFWLVDDAVISQVGTSWALLELSMWARRPALIWAGAGLVSAIYLATVIGESPSTAGGELFGLLIVIGLPVLLGLNVRGSRELSRQAEERAAEQQRRRESQARAAERSAIARELHDVVAHHVASMVLRVGVARHVLPEADPRVTEVFDDVHATGSAALADLRHLVAVLRDPDAVRGDAGLTAIEPSALPAALTAAVDRARSTGLTVDADIAASVGNLDAVRGLAVLRLTQEALTNVAKHAGPRSRARLSVRVDGGDVHWEVSDDGPPGADAVDRPPGGGHGLTGMRERVSVLGGTLEAGPCGPGWVVRTVLPAPASESSPMAAA
jgi:signal transduction histidine kinase